MLLPLTVWAQSAAFAQQDSVCAEVRIEIKQELTLERQAFDAHMRINNGLDDLALDNVVISVNFTDEQGAPVLATSNPNDTTAKFFIRVDTMEGIGSINGGTIAPSTSADIHWLIIPAPGAAAGSPTGKLYFVGANLSYTFGGVPESVDVDPDFITVKPLPELTLDYFLTQFVYADDAFTQQIEASVPFTLGVRIQNNGTGSAKHVAIDSAQPKIVENEQGLLINFEIIGSEVNLQPAAPTLLIDFGDIASGKASTGRWSMITTLSGEFTEFTAEFSHADELGGAVTSILEATNTHFLLRDVLVDVPGRDGVRDFLADDGGALRVYESDNVDTVVTNQSTTATLQFSSQNGPNYVYNLTTAATAGFMYAKLPDPFSGTRVVADALRLDGKRIPLHNVWFSKVRDINNNWVYSLNIFDANSSGQYQVTFQDIVMIPAAPVIQFIPDRTVSEGSQVSFIVEASDPNATIPVLTASGLPLGASFVDQGDGVAIFDWTPAFGQAGVYEITYIASDGALDTTQKALITVTGGDSDTDDDGLDDQWELDHFGTLDRDGNGDFDGDGISDLQEFLDGTDPTRGSAPLAPLLVSPLYGEEVTERQPTLTVEEAVRTGNAAVTYDFEVYADESMTALVAGVIDVGEIGLATTVSWQVGVVLDDNTHYFWRVRAYDGAAYSPWSNGKFFVNTANDPPGAFTISEPTPGAEVGTVNPLLAVTNAVDVDEDVLTYDFAVYADAGLSVLVDSVADIAAGAGGTTTWIVDSPLADNTLYYWQVTAKDDSSGVSLSPVGNFFVNTVNDAPSEPAIVAPPDGATVASATVVLEAGDAEDADGDPVFYEFEIDTVDTFDGPDKQSSGPIAAAGATTSWAVASLVEDSVYFWRVRASDGAAASPWVQASFRVDAVNSAPSVPTVKNPGNGAWVATLTPTLELNPSTDVDSAAVFYAFELYADDALTILIAETLTSSTNFVVPSPLVDNEFYFWRARAADDEGGVSEWSPASSFFVDANGVDDAPVLSWRRPNVDLLVSTGRVLLAWSDEDPDSNASISLFYDSDNAGADGTLIAEGIAEDLDEAEDNYRWDTNGIARGRYWFYAVIADGTTQAIVYTTASVELEPEAFIVDNTTRNLFEKVGDWVRRAKVSGFYGANYEEHIGFGITESALVLDNADPAFSASGDWELIATGGGKYGADYLSIDGNPEPNGAVFIDNKDNEFSTLGVWKTKNDIAQFYGTNYAYHAAEGISSAGIRLDNRDSTASFVGNWNNSQSAPGFLDTNYRFHNAGNGSQVFSWRADVLTSGLYRVYARWTNHAGLATSATYTLSHDAGASQVAVDQRQGAGQWNLLGTYAYTGGLSYAMSLASSSDGRVVADALKLEPVDAAPPNTAIWTFAPGATGQYEVLARWTAAADRATNATYVVNHAFGSTPVVVNQQIGGGQWISLGSFEMTAGTSYAVTLTDVANGLVVADALQFVPANYTPAGATWTFTPSSTGPHKVFGWWKSRNKNSDAVRYMIRNANGDALVTVNQKVNGGGWNLLGIFDFQAGVEYSVSVSNEADGFVVADAILVNAVDAPPSTFTWLLEVPEASFYEVFVRWTAAPDRATDAKLTLVHDNGTESITVNQQTDGATWNSVGTYLISPGSGARLTLDNDANGNVIADAVKLVPIF
jgi:hypothetical protein